MKRLSVVLLAFAALIFLGFFQALETERLARSTGIFRLIYLLVWFAPVLPAAMAVLRVARPSPASPALIRAAALAALLIGLLLTLLSAADASPHSTLMFANGIALSLAAASSVLFLAAGRIGSIGRWLAFTGMALSATAAVWSLLSVPAVVYGANRIAAGNPFCIGRHAPASEITSSWDLRGFSFYTTASGYKSTSGWYFHGLLVVDGPDGRQYFNWSPRGFRFDRIHHPERFAARVQDICEPTPAFWSKL